MHTKRVTLDTIAQRLDISRFSVSRALSGKGGVSERTRQLILDTAHELGYRHPRIDPGKNVGVSWTSTLFLPGDDSQGSEFWMKVMGGVQSEAERLGHTLITRSVGRSVPLRDLQQNKMDGAIVAGHQTRKILAEILPDELPKTLIGYPAPLEEVDAVSIADRSAGRAVGEYLRELGHSRIAYITEIGNEFSRLERFRGLHEAAENERKMAIAHVNIDLAGDVSSFDSVLSDLMQQEDAPTAFFCCTDVLAFSTIRTLNLQGFDVPRDVSVVGFNDYADSSQFAPALTTVRVPMHALGTTAMQVLHARLTEIKEDNPHRQVLLVPELIERGSSGPVGRFKDRSR